MYFMLAQVNFDPKIEFIENMGSKIELLRVSSFYFHVVYKSSNVVFSLAL